MLLLSQEVLMASLRISFFLSTEPPTRFDLPLSSSLNSYGVGRDFPPLWQVLLLLFRLLVFLHIERQSDTILVGRGFVLPWRKTGKKDFLAGDSLMGRRGVRPLRNGPPTVSVHPLCFFFFFCLSVSRAKTEERQKPSASSSDVVVPYHLVLLGTHQLPAHKVCRKRATTSSPVYNSF